MGLDMTLVKKIYIGGNYKHRNIKGIIKITKDEKPIKIDLNKVLEVTEIVGYWRKANHIHKWFVDNIQDGEDDCKEYYVSTEKLKELKSLCLEVKKSLVNSKTKKVKVKTGWNNKGDTFDEIDVFEDTKIAEELLPSASGFFFGDTEYDKYYIQDLDDTIEIINKALKDKYNEFYYSSSW